jgi:hypothetical protein
LVFRLELVDRPRIGRFRPGGSSKKPKNKIANVKIQYFDSFIGNSNHFKCLLNKNAYESAHVL